MLKAISAAVALALLACSTVPAFAADPTVTPLPFTQGGSTYQECTYNDSTHFWVCHLNYGWDYTNNRPKAVSVDPNTGNQNVFHPAQPVHRDRKLHDQRRWPANGVDVL